MYIYNTADVNHNAEMRETESSDEDDDSYEAQVCRLDEQDFPMADILGGHQDRLHADAPYRIPVHMLEPTRLNPALLLWRHPHTYLQRDFMPMTFATSKMRTRNDNSDGEQDQDDQDSDQEEEDVTLSRRFNCPNKSVPRHVQKLLDLAAEDEDKDPELDNEEEDQETQADKDFLDDREQVNDPVIRIPHVDALRHEAEHDDTVTLAAYYETAAAAANYGSGDDEKRRDEIPVIPGTRLNAGIGQYTHKQTLIGYAPVKIQQQLNIELTHGTWIRLGRGKLWCSSPISSAPTEQ
ncbi:hypothetical protein K438DRAFT_1952276 [Mycena galopus ATCC 62051]|nr:hypothetical protein K438DRAFT_1952276 [Mycena galopus ATCC 62051]